MWSGLPIVARGTWLYEGRIPVEVIIQKSPVWYGSGDHEDPASEREDRSQVTYYIWWGEPGKTGGNFHAGGGEALTLTEAKNLASKSAGTEIKWAVCDEN